MSLVSGVANKSLDQINSRKNELEEDSKINNKTEIKRQEPSFLESAEEEPTSKAFFDNQDKVYDSYQEEDNINIPSFLKRNRD